MQPTFVSHDTADAAQARAIVKALELDGIPCWIAPRNIPAGTNYGTAISDAIAAAGALLFLLSKESVTSQFCMKEVEYATSLGTLVIPVRLDRTELQGGLRFFLAGNQWVDNENPAARLDELLRALGHLRAGSTPLPGEAISTASTATNPIVFDGAAGLKLEDCRSLLSSMKYLRDPRNAPEGRRKSRFKAGWRSAASGRTYTDKTLEELKWDNLGWRLGDRFGEQPDDTMDAVFDLFAVLWHEVHC
ncbi:MAG: toll/interleukin-1 receptor domain-containing protein [Aquihabitans sp.]